MFMDIVFTMTLSRQLAKNQESMNPKNQCCLKLSQRLEIKKCQKDSMGLHVLTSMEFLIISA